MFAQGGNLGASWLVNLFSFGLLVFGVLLLVIMIGIIRKLFKKKV